MEPARLCRHVNHVAKLGISYRLKLPYNVDPDCDRKTVGLCNNSALVQSFEASIQKYNIDQKLGAQLVS